MLKENRVRMRRVCEVEWLERGGANSKMEVNSVKRSRAHAVLQVAQEGSCRTERIAGCCCR